MYGQNIDLYFYLVSLALLRTFLSITLTHLTLVHSLVFFLIPSLLILNFFSSYLALCSANLSSIFSFPLFFVFSRFYLQIFMFQLLHQSLFV